MYKKRGCGGSVQTLRTAVTHLITSSMAASLMKMNIRRRICISAEYLNWMTCLKRKWRPARRRAVRHSATSIKPPRRVGLSAQADKPTHHPDHTDGGGLTPAAVNPDYWDLVLHSDIHQQLESHDGVWRIRRHKHPHNALSNRSLHRKRKQLCKGLDCDQPDF